MTQEELKRLAKLSPGSIVTRQFDGIYGRSHQTHWNDGGMIGLARHVDQAMFAAIVSSLLAPWTAVPVGDEVMLCRVDIDSLSGDPDVYWYRVPYHGQPYGTPSIDIATRFQSPLHAAEALHQNTEKV